MRADPHSHRLRFIALLGVLLAPLACSSEPAANWSGTIETLPNGVVRVTNPSDGLWTSQGAWQLIGELVLGSADGGGADVFASISGLEVDQAGNIYVLDRQANELRIFNERGQHVRSVGRSGEGPGEYTRANGLTWISEDSLLVIDQEGNRYSVLARNGDYIRSVSRELPFYGWVFNGGVDGDFVYEVHRIGTDEESIPALLGRRVRGQDVANGVRSNDAQAPERGPVFAADTVLLARPDGPLYESFSVRTARAGMVIGVPFTGRPVYYLDGNGRIWHGHGGTARLYHSTLRGDTITEINLNTEPVPVTADEIAEFEAGRSIERFKSLGGKLDLSRIPKAKPYFDGITLDFSGNIWLMVPAAPRQAIFAVLDPDGRYLGQLQVDGVDRDAWVSPVLRNDRLYFVGRDELDVQRVYVYRVDKSGTTRAAAR